MRARPQSPPYRVLVISDDNQLVDDLTRVLARRPLQVHYAEAGPAALVLAEQPGLRFLAFARSDPQHARAVETLVRRYEVVALGDLAGGIAPAFHALREATQREGAQENMCVGIVGLALEHHGAVRRYLQESTFLIAVTYSREEAIDPRLLGNADLVLVDSKLGEIDHWAFVRKLIDADPGTGLPVFGIVPRIDVDILKQSVEHSVAGFLLRTLIDERLFPRLESVVRSGMRGRPPEFADDPRYAAPVLPPGEDGELSAPAVAAELEVAAAREVFHALARQPGFDDERAQAMVGRTFGKTKLQRVLGRGGSGTVYLGWHMTLSATVAVKLLFSEDVARDPRFAHRFIEEARIAARIEHPNIVRVIDFDRDDESGCYYLVMELVRGASLLQLIRSQGALDETSIIEIAAKVCEVLAVAKDMGIVHRDITPANILITERNNVKLADLGIAKLIEDGPGRTLGGHRITDKFDLETLKNYMDSSGAVPVRTATGVLLGTPLYMSPEQSENARLADFRSDMYSLGATLHHAATGHPPYSGLSIEDILRAHRDAPVPDARTDQPRLTRDTAALIRRLLSKSPRDRFASYDDLLTAISRCERTLRTRDLVGDLRRRGLRGRLIRFIARLLLPDLRG